MSSNDSSKYIHEYFARLFTVQSTINISIDNVTSQINYRSSVDTINIKYINFLIYKIVLHILLCEKYVDMQHVFIEINLIGNFIYAVSVTIVLFILQHVKY